MFPPPLTGAKVERKFFENFVERPGANFIKQAYTLH
jgi:hypothetical protein